MDQGRRKAHYRVRNKKDDTVHNIYIESGRTVCSCSEGEKCKAIVKALSSYIKVNKSVYADGCSYVAGSRLRCIENATILLDEYPLCSDHYTVMLRNY